MLPGMHWRVASASTNDGRALHSSKTRAQSPQVSHTAWDHSCLCVNVC